MIGNMTVMEDDSDYKDCNGQEGGLRSQEAGSSRLQGLKLVENRLLMRGDGRRNVFGMG